MRLSARKLLLFIITLMTAMHLHAQATATGTIVGTVTDTSQAVIVGA